MMFFNLKLKMVKNIRTYAIGDIHGEIEKLKKMIQEIEKLEEGNPYILQFLGDYVDRGPDSKAVIELIMALQSRRGNELVRAICGNHEVMAVESEYNQGAIRRAWIESGGGATIRSYGGSITNSHIEWIENLPLFYEDDLRFYVHAGVYPGIDLADQDENHMLWIRDKFLQSDWNWGKLIVHGHTVSSRVEIKKNRVGLDTGSCFGYALSAACFEQESVYPVKILQV